MSTNRRTLVLGGSGFLGAHLVRAALERARDDSHGATQVLVLARDPRVPAAALLDLRGSAALRDRRGKAALRGLRGKAALRDLRGKAALRDLRENEAPIEIAMDARDLEAVRSVLERHAPTHVLSAAAVSRVDAAERDPVGARRVNTELPGVLAEWTRRHGARLVHVSTDLVFGGDPPRASGYREDDPVDPRSVYGRTKAEAEVAVSSLDPRAAIVRLPLLFGESFGRGLGASDGLFAALARGERPALFTDEWRTPLDVAVAARVLVRWLDTDLGGCWHVGGSVRTSRHELGVSFLRQRGVSEPEACVASSTRAAAGLGDRPRDVSLDSARARERMGEYDAQGELA